MQNLKERIRTCREKHKLHLETVIITTTQLWPWKLTEVTNTDRKAGQWTAFPLSLFYYYCYSLVAWQGLVVMFRLNLTSNPCKIKFSSSNPSSLSLLDEGQADCSAVWVLGAATEHFLMPVFFLGQHWMTQQIYQKHWAWSCEAISKLALGQLELWRTNDFQTWKHTSSGMRVFRQLIAKSDNFHARVWNP